VVLTHAALVIGQHFGAFAKHHQRAGHLTDLVCAIGTRNPDRAVSPGEPGHDAGNIAQRSGHALRERSGRELGQCNAHQGQQAGDGNRDRLERIELSLCRIGLSLQLLLDGRRLFGQLAAADVDRVGQRIAGLRRAVRLDRGPQGAQFGFETFDLGHQPFHLVARGRVAAIQRNGGVDLVPRTVERVEGQFD
jgi:hypothetical protein